ncbi:MAG: phosphoribosylformylglycinamidine cyclo-ligase, partial [Acutalibacteraceae bacterium]
DIVKGVADGCVMGGCALVGGETAEMPGFYDVDEYDVAGFSVGVVDKKKILDKTSVKEGDVIIALPSSGFHSNGFSLVRKVFDVERDGALDEKLPEYDGKTLGEVLLTPTKIYVKPILKLLDSVKVKSIAHITGGGFFENIPRALPDGIAAQIDKASVKTPPIFDIIAKRGGIAEREMFNTFNMGVGMTVIVDENDADTALEVLKSAGEDAYILGKTVKGDSGVILA